MERGSVVFLCSLCFKSLSILFFGLLLFALGHLKNIYHIDCLYREPSWYYVGKDMVQKWSFILKDLTLVYKFIGPWPRMMSLHHLIMMIIIVKRKDPIYAAFKTHSFMHLEKLMVDLGRESKEATHS